MRSKKIISIVAFVAAFGFSAAFAGLFITKTTTVTAENYAVYESKSTSCFFRQKQSLIADQITFFVNEDKRNGRESERVAYEYGENIFTSSDSSAISGYAGAVEEYVNDSSSMAADDLPTDFQVEWREHMKAWRDYSDFLNRMKKSSNRDALSVDEIKAIDNLHGGEISRTWNEVLQNGRTYGAVVY